MRRLLTYVSTLIIAAIAVAQSNEIIIPKPIGPGSRIAIITPASAIKDAQIDTTYVRLQQMGYEPVIFPHAYGRSYGSYAAADRVRAAEIMEAFTDPSIDAILCSRGGYGCVRLLPMLDIETIRQNPKWLIGYSDISDLHAIMHKAGVASIHGPMAGHLATEPDTIPSTQYLFKVLADSFPMQYQLAPHPYNKTGKTTGRLVGGNLITIDALAETPYDILNIGDEEDIIIFFEDVSEQIYRIERVLMRLHYSGILSKAKGLVVGQFTEYRPSDDFETMEDMIHYWLEKWGYYSDDNPMPIVYDFPTGHVSQNYPMIVSAETILEITPEGTTLTFTGN